MKIFNKENEQEKVYVQLNDIMELIDTDMSIPASIVDAVFGTKMLIVDDSNREDFVEFDKKEEVEFFKSIDWIVDYKKYRDLSKEELETLIEDIVSELGVIANKYNSLSIEEKKANVELCEKYRLLYYKLGEIKQILYMKSGDYNPKLPVVPDSDRFSLESNGKNNLFKLSVSLDPKKYLLYRVDGKELHSDTIIPSGFLQSGLCLALMERKNGSTEGECEVSYKFSEDNKYLVIDIKELEQKNYKTNSNKQEKKGFRKLLKRVFDKMKKSWKTLFYINIDIKNSIVLWIVWKHIVVKMVSVLVYAYANIPPRAPYGIIYK